MTTPRLDTSRPCRLRGVAFVVPGFDADGGRGPRRLAECLAGQGVPITYVTTATRWVEAPAREVRGIVQVFRVPSRSIGDGRTSRDLLELFALGLLAARRERVEAVYGVHPGAEVAVRVAAALGAPAVVELSRPPTARDVALRGAEVLVAPTAAIARDAEVVLGVPRQRVVRSTRGVDLTELAPRPAPAGRRTVLVDEAAGPAELDALTRVAAGRGLALERRAGAPGPELQRDLAAWVLPRPVEAPDDALLEALACGVPTIVVRSPGVAEALRDGEALVVDDPLATAAALERVLADPELASRLGKAGRARAEDAFDLEQVAARHAVLFEELKARRNGAGAGAGAGARAGAGAGLDGLAVARVALGAMARAGRDATRSTLAALRDLVRR